MAFNRPFWQNNPDPAKRITPALRPGGKPTVLMELKREGKNALSIINTYVCPHCGKVGVLRAKSNKSIFKHFAYCEHKDKTMSKEELTEIVEEHDLKKCLMNQYGDFILTHEELLKVMSTIALDKKDPRSALAIKLMYDYHDKISNKPDEAQELGFTGFVFEVLPTKQELDALPHNNNKGEVIDVEAKKDRSNTKTPK